MKKTPIKITLSALNSALSGSGDYRIKRIAGAITVDADKRTNLIVGNVVTTQEAKQLCRNYAVTVTI